MTVRPARSADRMRRVTRSTSAAVMPSSSACVRGRRPSACWEPIERRRRRACTGRGSQLWASECRCRPDALPSIATSSVSSERRDLADSADALGPQLVRRDRPDAPEPFDRQGMQEVAVRVRVRRATARRAWRHRSRPWRGTSCAATPTVIGRPTSSHHVLGAGAAICDGCARDPGQARDVEERLVDRQRLDQRCRVLEHLEHRPARLGVRVGSRVGDDQAGAQPARLPSVHRRAHAERLGLVARGEHDTAADGDGLAAQARVVALLDRREEAVEVGVEDRGATVRGHEHMFA